MSEQTKEDNRTRGQKAKALHELRTKERKSDSDNIKADYTALRDHPVMQDILTKCANFASYHTKVSKDGIATRVTGGRNADGQTEVETITLDVAQRISHLDKAAGQEEIYNYIMRQFIVAPVETDEEKPEEEPETE